MRWVYIPKKNFLEIIVLDRVGRFEFCYYLKTKQKRYEKLFHWDFDNYHVL